MNFVLKCLFFICLVSTAWTYPMCRDLFSAANHEQNLQVVARHLAIFRAELRKINDPENKRLAQAEFDGKIKEFLQGAPTPQVGLEIFAQAMKQLEDKKPKESHENNFAEKQKRNQITSEKTSIETWQESRLVPALSKLVAQLTLSQDAAHLLAISDFGIEATLIDTRTLKKLKLPHLKNPIQSGRFSADGTKLILASHQGLQLIDINTLQEIPLPFVKNEYLYQADISADGTRILSVGLGGRVHLYDLVRKIEVPLPAMHGNSNVTSASFAAHDTVLVTISMEGVKIFDLDNNELIPFPEAGESGIYSFIVSKDGENLWTSQTDGQVHMMNLRTKEKKSFQMLTDPVEHISMTADGSMLLAVAKKQAAILQTSGAMEITPVPLEKGFQFINKGLINQEGARALLISYEGLRSIDLHTLQDLKIPLPRSGDFRAATISPDESRIYIGDSNGNIYVWSK